MKLTLQEGLLSNFNATIPWNLIALGTKGIEISANDCQLTFSLDFDDITPAEQINIDKQADMVCPFNLQSIPISITNDISIE